MDHLEAVIRCEDYVHFRPATIITRICKLFPATEFTIKRASNVEESVREIDPKSFLNVATACLLSGEKVQINTTGPNDQLAAAFLKGTLENLNVLYTNTKSQSPRPMEEEIAALLSRIAMENPDPQRHAIMRLVDEQIRKHKRVAATPYPSPAHDMQVSVSASMHGAVVEALTRIAKHYNCALLLQYVHPVAGELTFDISSEDDWVKFDLLAFTPPRGTPITIKAFGNQCEALCHLMAGMLQNLAKVDACIRTCILNKRTDEELVRSICDIVQSGVVSSAPSAETDTAQDYRLNDLLMRELIIVDHEARTKGSALDRLVARLGEHSGMETQELRKLVGIWSERVYVCSDGFAYVHARAHKCPLIMLAFGIYPQGLEWHGQQDRKSVLAIVVAAIDAPNTYLGYVGRLLGIFRHNRPLVSRLVEAKTPTAVMQLIKEADASAQLLRESNLSEKCQRLLLVESFEDDMTIQRHEILAASPRMRAYHAEYLYAIGNDSATTAQFDKAEFVERLRTRIVDFMPDYVLFHSGSVYMQHLRWFEDMIRELRSRFRSVRFGCQQRKGFNISENVFSNDKETATIQSLVFEEILGI